MKLLKKIGVFILAAILLVTSVTSDSLGSKAATGDEYTVQPAGGKENLNFAGATGTLFTVNGTYNGFCIDRDRGHYSAATTYTETATVITDPANKLYQTFYFGYGGPGYGEVYSFANETEAIVATNQAASHFYSNTSSGMNYTAAIEGLPADKIPPRHDMSLSAPAVTAYVSGTSQVTDWITLNLDSRLTASATIPDGVTLWIEGDSTGHTGTADIQGGKRFYLSAPLTADGIKTVTLQYTGNKMLKIIVLAPPSNSYQPVAFYTNVNPAVSLNATFDGKGELEIVKSSSNPDITDNNNCYSLAGAVYGVYGTYGNAYNDTNRITTITTDATGYGKASDLILGTYYVKEITAPQGFNLDKGIYTANINSATTATRLNLTDTPGGDPLEIVVRKKDADEDIYLTGAKFVVKYYDIQMDSDPALAGEVPERTWYLVTGDGIYQGTANLESRYLDPDKTSDAFYYQTGDPTIPLGTITVQEYDAPTGYVIDDTVYTFKITADMVDTPTIDLLNQRTLPNRKIKQPFSIKKYGRTTEGNIPLSRAGFMAAPVSELNQDNQGNYIWDVSKAIALTDTGEKELITDDSGYALSCSLEYGTYLVRETTVPAHFKPCEDFLVVIDTDSTTPKEYVRYDDYNPPVIGTTAKDKATESHIGALKERTSIIDTVNCRNLLTGKQYTIKGILMDKATGEPFLDNGSKVLAEKTFTAIASEMSVDMEYTFNSTALSGKSVVVFETLYYDGKEIAVHNDLSDEEQTVNYPGIGTTAKDKTTESHIGMVGEKTTIVDTVSYSNLVPGKQYTIKGILMDKATGEPFLDNGSEIIAEKTFDCSTASGSVDMEYTFNSTSLAGKSVVVYENLYYEGIELVAHNDISDEGQTVDYPPEEVPPVETPPTGDNFPVVLLIILMCAAVVGIVFVIKKRD